MPPPRSFINQNPKGIKQSNRMLIIIGVLILSILILYFTLKNQRPKDEDVTNQQVQPKMDYTTKSIGPEWLDKFKNIQLNPEAALLTESMSQIEKRAINHQELMLNKAIISDQFNTQFEIQKIENKDKIDEKKLEIQAARSIMALPVTNPPQSSVQQEGDSSITSKFDQMGDVQSSISALKNTEQKTTEIDPNNQDEKRDFLRSQPEESDYLSKSLQEPKSPYEVKAATLIPGALITGINSDMPGTVVGQVTENVRDTVTGNFILIPQGTKIIGSYDSKVSFGQNRVLVVWDRLIFPDGSSIDLGRLQGVDVSGYAGLAERVNNHYFKMYANALLLSFVGAGYDALNNSNNSNASGQMTAQQEIAANVGQQLSNVASKTLEKNIDVQPTITISPGHQFDIIVTKDMVLKEVKDVEGTLAYSE